jgi:deoxyribodipyrimidine photolyase-related protein
MNKHRSFFIQNPRLGMLVRIFDNMPQEKKEIHITNGEEFLKNLAS